MIDKLFIAIPHMGDTTIEWAISLRMLRIDCPYLVGHIKGFPIHVAREELVRDAKESEASHILFLDSDIILPQDAIQRLSQYEYPVVSALYASKRGEWCSYVRENGRYKSVNNVKEKLHEADAVGLGACLIDMRVFEELEPPYFHWTLDGDGGKSEDVLFCEKLKEKGFSVVVDGTVIPQHVYQGAVVSPTEVKTLTV